MPIVPIKGLTCKQAEVLKWWMAGTSTTTIIKGSRGAGKSGLARIMIGVQSQRFPGKNIIYASQSCSNSEAQFDQCIKNPYIRSLLRQPSGLGMPFSKQPPTLHFANGTDCIFWSLERSEQKRGMHVPLVICDEAQSVADYDYNDILNPMIDVPGGYGKMVVLGSCSIYNTWYHDLSEKGLKFPNDADVKTFTILPHESKTFEGPEGQRRLMQKKAAIGESAFNSEYLLISKQPGDSYFKGAHIEQCLIDGSGEPSSDEPTILAYDISTGSIDPAAIAVMNADGKVLYSFSFPQDIDFKDKHDHLGKIARRYHSFVVFDSNGCFSGKDIIMDNLNSVCPYGVDEMPMDKHNKVGYFDAFGLDLENKAVSIPRGFEELVKQMQQVCCKKSSSGYISIGSPYKSHDDELACVVLAREAIRQGYLGKLRDKSDPYQRVNFGTY